MPALSLEFLSITTARFWRAGSSASIERSRFVAPTHSRRRRAGGRSGPGPFVRAYKNIRGFRGEAKNSPLALIEFL